MQVKIIADPTAIYNTHEIEVIGDFGKIKTTTNNLPSENPRTSYLALLSAINILKNMKNNIKIGN
jgi:aspartate dehydrogenase